LSLESLLRASSAFVLFECGLSRPSNRSFGPAAPPNYSSVGSFVPRIALSGQQHLGIIRVRAILSLKVHCSYSSSAGYLVPRSALLIFFECRLSCPLKCTAHILRLQAILSLEAHCSYSSNAGSSPSNCFFWASNASKLFECELRSVELLLLGQQRLHNFRMRALASRIVSFGPSAPLYYSRMGSCPSNLYLVLSMLSYCPKHGSNKPVRMPYVKYEGKSTVGNTRWPGIRIKRSTEIISMLTA
jgi:hypothetical protein